ncbi:MAG: type VI secretion system lysozyme-like protein [Myxococcota bacterium]|jgi:type VI secretion system lysozyme-like protein
MPSSRDPAQSAPAPLFDRLASDGAEQFHFARVTGATLGRSGVRHSVFRELTRLLNSRCQPGGRTKLTVLDYGVPSWEQAGLNGAALHEALCGGVREAIEAFEPRLSHVEVTVEEQPGPERDIILRVDARLRGGGSDERVYTRFSLREDGVGISTDGT